MFPSVKSSLLNKMKVNVPKASFIRRKIVPGERVTLPTLFPGSLFSASIVVDFLNDNGGREERPWERGCHPPSLVYFSERLLTALSVSRVGFSMTTVLTHALIALPWSSWPGWASQTVFIYIEKSWPRLGRWPYHRKRLTRLGGSPFYPSQLFVSRVNGSSSFVKKCWKTWLAQGSSGRSMALSSGRTFLHINRSLVIPYYYEEGFFCIRSQIPSLSLGRNEMQAYITLQSYQRS